MPVTIDGTNGITTPTYGGTDTSEYLVPVTAFKNRIINGAMSIWQRGTSSTTSSAGYYTADRWASFFTAGSGTTAQDTASANLPSGARFGLKFTSSGANSGCNFYHTIETSNCFDLAGQTANLSLSICGTSGRQVTIYIAYSTTTDAAFTSSFLSAAQTTVTLSTTPTLVSFNGSIPSTARTVQVLLTSATTFNNTEFFSFTNVQLEKGSTATSFDYRPYGQELVLCERYCQVISGASIGRTITGNIIGACYMFPVLFRAAPTATNITYTISTGATGTTATFGSTVNSIEFYNAANNWTAQALLQVSATLSAEL